MPPIRTDRAAPRSTMRTSPRPPPRPGASSGSGAVAVGLLLTFLVSAAALAFIAYQVLLAAPRPELRESPERLADQFSLAARQFASLKEFEQAQPLGPGVAVRVTVAEAELNSRLAGEMARQRDLPIKDVSARILHDQVDFSGRAATGGLDVNGTVALRFGAAGGALTHEVLSVSFGILPVPDFVRQAIADSVAGSLGGQRAIAGLALEAVQQRPGAITLLGRTR